MGLSKIKIRMISQRGERREVLSDIDFIYRVALGVRTRSKATSVHIWVLSICGHI